MISQYDKITDTVRHYSINACLASVCSVHGFNVTTVEGIGSIKTGLHPCQERIAKAHGSQCGFCTPVFVMSMYTLLRNNPSPTQEEVEHAFEGNLCRCTGYRPIIEGYKTFCPCGKDNEGGCCAGSMGEQQLFDSKDLIPYSPDTDKDYIFPPKLKISPPPPLNVVGNRVSWFQPSSLKELVILRNTYPRIDGQGKPQYKLLVGSTEIGVETQVQKMFYPVLINVARVPELLVMKETDKGLVVGASVTLSNLNNKLKNLVHSLPPYKTRAFQAFIEMLRWFAGPQIRNVSSLAGNIITASPISDLNPILMACNAELVLASIDGERTVQMDQSFITGYRKTSVKENEVLVSILIRFTSQDEYVMGYKQSRRREDDIAIVNGCMRVMLDPSSQEVKDCSLVYGGMSYKTLVAKRTQQALVGRKLDRDIVSFACSSLADELAIEPSAPGGMPDFRLCLALSFFYKFFLSVFNQIGKIPPEESSATEFFQRPVSKGTQGFQRVSSSQLPSDPVGRPLMNVSSLKQASGEAKYIDDLPRFENELYAGLVLSQKAHAQFSLDTRGIVGMKGVHGIVTAEDVPGSNKTGLFNDESVFAVDKVTSVGQVIAVVLAEDELIASRAVSSVEVTYKDLPPVITIEDARKANSFNEEVHTIKCGDVESAQFNSDHICTGSMRTGAQEHFYLETNVCIAIPKGEEGEMEIISSTQCVDGTQGFAAKALGIPANRILAKVKRIGGGFGGKETRNFTLSTAIAVAANKAGVPVRVMMSRSDDMMYSGMRHPFLGEYRAGFTKDGVLTSYELELFSNTGYSTDLGTAVMERALTHCTNAYKVPHAKLTGKICQTNTPSNTAFRGFGGPQGMMMVEDLMDRAAYELNMDPAELRYRNLLRNGDTLPYGTEMNDCHMIHCWETLLERSDYWNRKLAIEEFNKLNKWTKQGIAIIPTMYGIAFGLSWLNQGGALVHVYKDGSVLVTHGGMEMGQGLHTKIIQICSRCFDIPHERIFISETSTDKVPNASPTAASSSSDLYGEATKDACDQIMERLEPLKEEYPGKTWNELVELAYKDRINLSAQGFYKTPDIGFDWKKGRGRPYNYYCFGVGCSEVEVDTLAGGFKILRTDLLMDVGNSLNPAIDIGQVEGAFTQGLGLFTMEEVVYLKEGQLFTNGPGNYKIPSCSDIPIELNVSLMDRTPNPRAIFSSKAVGEPPLFLAASVFFAIKDAIRSARVDRGHSPVFDLIAPATAERIRMACEDQFTAMVKSKMEEKFPSPVDSWETWNVIP